MSTLKLNSSRNASKLKQMSSQKGLPAGFQDSPYTMPNHFNFNSEVGASQRRSSKQHASIKGGMTYTNFATTE